jgi:RIO-like serine/threonine protein kinase
VSGFEKPRNRTKADVRRVSRDGRELVIKDYGPRGALVRLFYGRPTLRREARVYERLAGVAGIPRCCGFETPDALLLEFVPGLDLGSFEAGALAPSIFDELDRVLAAVHARGVAIADLHRSNVLVDTAAAAGSRVHVIDFAIARIARAAERPGFFIRALQQLDRHAAARLRARALGLPEPRAEGWFGWIYRIGRRLKP